MAVVSAAIILIFATGANANNGTRFSKSDFEQLEKDYIAAAFGGTQVQLSKFHDSGPLRLSAVCDSNTTEKCMETISWFKFSLSDLLRIQKTKGKSDIEVVLAEKKRLPTLRAELEKLYNNETIDNKSVDCQLYVRLAGAVVAHAVVVVSVDLEPLRAQTCFLVNFARSLGLSPIDGKSFPDFWGGAAGSKAEISQVDYEELRYRINVLLVIHSCETLTYGMTKREAERELDEDSMCLKRLEVLSNG